MDTIQTATILDRGVKYLNNHPDSLVRRTVLAQVLVDARLVRTIEAGVLAFRLWSVPGAAERYDVRAVIQLANERASRG
jgi:hypothetical protein